jgi:pimeloyl-ACP methyl ester carboxylesterase
LVILIHGFFQTRNIWEVMEDRLRHDGFGVISFNLGGLLWRYNTRPIDKTARYVAEKVEYLSAREGFQAVHLIGHSKGGLIARRYVQHYGGDKRVKSLITLGTPHRGTAMALAAVPILSVGLLGSSLKDLLPHSRVISRLQQDTFPSHIPLTSIYSSSDLVCPHWSSVLRPRPGETSMNNVRIRGIGHSQLTWDGGVYQVAKHYLDEASRLWAERHQESLRT